MAFILFPGREPKESAKATACLANLKHLDRALLLYANAKDDRLPDRDSWMDCAMTYGKEPGIDRCPNAPVGLAG